MNNFQWALVIGIIKSFDLEKVLVPEVNSNTFQGLILRSLFHSSKQL